MNRKLPIIIIAFGFIYFFQKDNLDKTKNSQKKKQQESKPTPVKETTPFLDLKLGPEIPPAFTLLINQDKGLNKSCKQALEKYYTKSKTDDKVQITNYKLLLQVLLQKCTYAHKSLSYIDQNKEDSEMLLLIRETIHKPDILFMSLIREYMSENKIFREHQELVHQFIKDNILNYAPNNIMSISIFATLLREYSRFCRLSPQTDLEYFIKDIEDESDDISSRVVFKESDLNNDNLNRNKMINLLKEERQVVKLYQERLKSIFFKHAPELENCYAGA